MSLTDVQGLQLEVGDHVVSTYNKYAHMVVFEVIGFTAQRIRVRVLDETSVSGYPTLSSHKTTLKSSMEVAKVPKVSAPGVLLVEENKTSAS